MTDLMELAQSTLHSKLGASSMYRWSLCPGSVRLSETVPPSPTSSYAAEGHLAHEIAAEVLQGLPWRKGIDPEMQSHIEIYVEEVLKTWDRAKKYKDSKLVVEQRFDLSKIKPGLFGTADAVIWDARDKVLSVYDLKFGAGIPVSVERNPQLMYYALGALLESSIEPERIEIFVVQPRCAVDGETIRSWDTTLETLLDFAMELFDYAEATEQPDARLVPGEPCRFCPAATVCPEVKAKSKELASIQFGEVYDPSLLSEALKFIPIFQAWSKNVEEFAFSRLSLGEKIPGYKLVEKKTHRKWKDEGEAVKVLRANGLTDQELFEIKIKTPAKIEKILGKDGDIVNTLSEAPPGGPVITEESDKRSEIQVIQFTKV